MNWIASRSGVIVLSALAFLAYMERALLDWRFVVGDFATETDIATTVLAMAFYLLVSAAWLWGLMAAARGSRNGLWTLLALSLLLLVGLGVATPVSFCPSPCQTAWPLMEVSNWAGLVVGLLAALSAWLRLRRPAGAEA